MCRRDWSASSGSVSKKIARNGTVRGKPAREVWLEDGCPQTSFYGCAEVGGRRGGLGNGITRITVSGQWAKRGDRFAGCLTTRQCRRRSGHRISERWH